MSSPIVRKNAKKAFKPCVGIAGVTLPPEVAYLAGSDHGDAESPLVLAFMADHRTLMGEVHRRPNLFPGIQSVVRLFSERPGVLNVIDYSTEYPETLLLQLNKLLQFAKRNLHGIQLSGGWPSIDQVQTCYEIGTFTRRHLILAVGPEMIQAQQIGGSPEKLADMIGHYLPALDAVFIDPGGTGKVPFDVSAARALLGELWSRAYPINLGIAGNINADSIEPIEPLFEEFPGLSVFVQDALRSPFPEDRLLFEEARRFIFAARSLIAASVR